MFIIMPFTVAKNEPQRGEVACPIAHGQKNVGIYI